MLFLPQITSGMLTPDPLLEALLGCDSESRQSRNRLRVLQR